MTKSITSDEIHISFYASRLSGINFLKPDLSRPELQRKYTDCFRKICELTDSLGLVGHVEADDLTALMEQESHKATVAELLKLVDEEWKEKGIGEVSEKDKQQQDSQPQEKEIIWQERVKRRVGIDRHAKVQMEVLMRPEVRPDIIALGIAHGMAGQKYIEHLIVDAINKNPELVTKGAQYIKRAKGNIRRAIALAQEDGAAHFQDELDTPISSRPR